MKSNKWKFIFCQALVFGILITPAAALGAGDFITCDGPAGIKNGVACDVNKLLEMINKVISYLAFRLVPIVATIVILLAGLRVVWNPEKVSYQTELKNILYTVVMGLVIVFSAYLIVQAIIFGLVADNSVGTNLKNTFK